MEAHKLQPIDEKLVISKRDLIQAWSVLEKLVISLRRMGGHYATASAADSLPPERRLEMLNQLHEFFSADRFEELARAREAIGKYVPDDEGEEISDTMIQYWQPPEIK